MFVAKSACLGHDRQSLGHAAHQSAQRNPWHNLLTDLQSGSPHRPAATDRDFPAGHKQSVDTLCNQFVHGNPHSRSNPQRDIAGISSADGRIVGLMPHPEHATEALTGPSDDGLGIFYSALDAVLSA